MSDIKKQLILEVSLGTQKLKDAISKAKGELDTLSKSTSTTSTLGTQRQQKEIEKAAQKLARQQDLDQRKTQRQERQMWREREVEEKRIRREEKQTWREKESSEKKTLSQNVRWWKDRENAEKRIAREDLITSKSKEVERKKIEKEERKAWKDKESEEKRISREERQLWAKRENEQKKSANAEAKVAKERENSYRALAKEMDKEQKKREVIEDRAAKKRELEQKKLNELRLKVNEEAEMSDSVGSGGKGGGPRGPGRLVKGLKVGLLAAEAANLAYGGYQHIRSINAQQQSDIAAKSRAGDFAGAAITGTPGSELKLAGGMGALGGALKYGAMGAVGGSIFGPAGTLVGGALGAAYGGITGAFSGTKEERELRLAETQPARAAMERQRQLSEQRVELSRNFGRTLGGTDPMARLTSLQYAGVQKGFSQERSLNQLGTLMSYVGANEAANSLTRGQDFFNKTGVDVDTQGQLREAITGAGRKSTFAGSTNTMESIIRRGMAYGIKDGKLDQYAKITADAVERNANMGGAQNSEKIADEILSRARSLQGVEGDLTAGSLQRAADIQDMVRNASSQTTGIAGAGNFLAVQSAAKESGINLSPMQIQLAAEASNKGGSAVADMLRKSGQFNDEDIQTFVSSMSRKKSDLAGQLSGNNSELKQFLTNRIFGVTTEKGLDINQSGAGYSAQPLSEKDIAGRGRETTGKEGALQIKQLEIDVKTFQTGMDEIGKSLELAKIAVDKYTEVVGESFKKLRVYVKDATGRSLGD